MLRHSWFQTFLTIIIIAGITTMLFLYTSGYRLTKNDNNTIDLTKNGMISAKSIPQGASVYLNGVLITATDGTISGIEPGTHNLKIVKTGFVTWTKDIQVFPELVTDITAVLISQSPRLEPLTNTGAKYPSMSSTLSKLAYFSKDPENPGITILSLAQEGLSLFRSNTVTVLKDTLTNVYSNGTTIEWAPDEKSLLVGNDKIFYLVDLATDTAQTTTTPATIRENWAKQLVAKRTDFIQKVDIPDDIKKLAVDPKSIWAPDDKKFLYAVNNGLNIEYRVYNMEKPIPVGENAENIAFVTKATDTQPKVSWYSDSFHLILTENYTDATKKGVISLIRIDGTNKTELYNNTLFSDQVFSAPSGDKIIMLTSFKSGEQTDLYTISIR